MSEIGKQREVKGKQEIENKSLYSTVKCKKVMRPNAQLEHSLITEANGERRGTGTE